MRNEEDASDLMGPGVDLAMSLSGILMILVVITVIQLWLTSTSARQTEGRYQEASASSSDAGKYAAIPRDEADAAKRNATNARAEAEAAKKDAAAARSETDVAERNAKDARAETDAAKKDAAAARLEADVAKRNATNARAEAESARAEHEVAKKEAAVARAEANRQGQIAAEEVRKRKLAEAKLNDRPPLITISDAKFRTFKEASSEISPELSQFLSSTVAQLYRLRAQYQANVIEVTGHTDEVKLGPSMRLCNLDENLIDVLNGRKDIKALGPCDNVGLGIARATAVVSELRARGLGKDFVLLPLSAGPAIDTDETMARGGHMQVPLPARRRIEIRLRRQGE